MSLHADIPPLIDIPEFIEIASQALGIGQCVLTLGQFPGLKHKVIASPKGLATVFTHVLQESSDFYEIWPGYHVDSVQRPRTWFRTHLEIDYALADLRVDDRLVFSFTDQDNSFVSPAISAIQLPIVQPTLQ